MIFKRGAVELVINHILFSASTSLPSIKEVGREMAQGRCEGEASKQTWVAVPPTSGEPDEKAHPLARCSG